MSYKFETIEELTIITPTHTAESGLPKVECHVAPCCHYYVCTVYIDGKIVITADVQRGKAFAVRVAKYMVKGVLSRLGHHRRLTANRAARKTAEAKEVA